MTIERLDIDKLIARSAALFPWRLPLYRAVKQSLIAVVEVPQGLPIDSRVERLPGPTVMLIGDDSGMTNVSEPLGPAGFPAARRLLRYWARGVVLHSAGGEEKHYVEVVRGALVLRNLVLIETDSEHHDEWQSFAGLDEENPRIPVLSIKVRNPALPHPLRPTRQ